MPQPANPTGPKVLLVEDNDDIAYIGMKKLAAAGYQPIHCIDGLDALRRIVDHPDCRLMVTDFMMPNFGGNYWIRLLERFCSDWTIVVVSTEDVDPGPFLSIPKPVDYENLVTLFARHTP